MKNTITAKIVAAAASVALLTGLAACGGSGSSATTAGGNGKSLVTDMVFDLKTLDPARAFEFTSKLLNHQVYESALTYGDNGKDLSKVESSITSYKISDDAKTVTLTMNGTHTFSSGDKVTAEDVAFSLKRVEGINGNPGFLLNDPAGKPVQISQPDDKTVVLQSSVANPALPYILPNPSLGIVEKKVVTEHGGTDDSNDKADSWLNSNSIGSGPYKVASVDIKSQVKLVPNDKYNGPKPTYTNVVVQNVAAPTQKVNLQAGSAQIGMDVSADDAAKMNGGNTKVDTNSSLFTFFTFFNAQQQYGKQAANPKFVAAFRHALDYKSLVKFAGEGAVQPGGLVPKGVIGAMDKDENLTYDPTEAKKLLSESGYNGEAIDFLTSSDYQIGGVSLQALAQKIQEQVKKVGINLQIKTLPAVSYLDAYRSGTYQAGLSFWQADYPDPSDYAAFGPDQTVGKRAGWVAGSNDGAAKVSDLLSKASAAVSSSDRDAAWQNVQKAMNEGGPFVPFLVPGSRLVYSSSVSNVNFNEAWYVDFASLK